MSVVSAAAVAAGTGPDARTLLVLVPLLVLVLALDAYCLFDLVRRPVVRYLPKAAWAAVIVLISAPFGALAYLVWGRGPDDRHGFGLGDDEIEEVRRAERGRPGVR